MKKENIKTIINFIITVLTAIASTFCMQSCILKGSLHPPDRTTNFH